MPGYGKLSFMIYLKSLIDPSFFRIEEQHFRGRLFKYAVKIESTLREFTTSTWKEIIHYYNLIRAVFDYQEEEFSIQHDHSMAYRHRNKNGFVIQIILFRS